MATGFGRRLRRMAMGLSTVLAPVLGTRARGFFIPYRYAQALPAAEERVAYAVLAERFRAAEPAFRQYIGRMEALADPLEAIGAAPPPAPRWRQDWFPRLDGAAAYAMVRHFRPRRVVEVGSGHSTRFLARAVADGGLKTRITAIDPAPRADIGRLGVEVIRQTVQETVQAAGAKPFAGLGSGDMLSMDSSHILMPGSDVDTVLNAILPSLPPGVLVHIHDIFLPDPYPEAWEWRAYNEQQGVAALIQGGGYEILWSSHHVATTMGGALDGTVLCRLERLPGAWESSLWLRKTG